ncbi:MAG TPA: hypothetical protein PKA42_02070 [Candidatus Paceibacterota bacterium]|nr:hypothetical protein [Candidatus Paceibacterota bacterium]HMO82931.1 hypothetical protein [Candidatus Paceibacterota bacterium]
MTQKWNLQDIRPAESRRRQPATRPLNVSQRPTVPNDDNVDDGSEPIAIHDGNKSKKKKYLILSTIVVILIGSIFGLSALLSKTTLTVFPEFREPVVNADFIAYPNRRDNSLSYEILTIDDVGEKQVQASGEEYVESQAKGVIEIIKTTPGSERLIKNTRFRSPDGLIFRIQESVVVPGALKDTTGALVPGTIQAEVFADTVGQEYNLAANTRFDVPGFKESNLNELYASIYAVNREAIAGGYKGQKFLINDAELSKARQELQLELRTKLLEKVNTEKPAGFTTFGGSIAINYEALPTVSYGENLVTIREQAVLQLPLFKQDEFASYIARETISTYNREPVRIVDTSTLSFSYKDLATNSSNLANLTAIDFTLSGKPLIVSEFDAKQLQKDLAGKAKTSISTVLTGHPGIKSARVSAKPFWRNSFPEEPTAIIIVEVIGEGN